MISLPVAGLRPVLAARSADLKVPKPINAISSPAFTVLTTWAIRASKISLTSALDFPVSSATAATNSVLLNSFLLKKLRFVKSKSKLNRSFLNQILLSSNLADLARQIKCKGLNMKKQLLAMALGLTFAVAANAADAQYRLVIHGGAGNITADRFTPEQQAEYHAGLQKALLAGNKVLASGGTAIDAVKAAINEMELNPIFNAGRGAVFTNEGKNELDSSIMDGKTLMAGAVAGVTNIKHPINCADIVRTKSPHVMMATKGAEKFCAQNGAETVDPKWFFTQNRYDQLKKAQEKEQVILDHDGATKKKTANAELYIDPLMYDYKYGTVGAVALDKDGNLAAGTSTGGMTNKRYGRIGDSPVIGAGTYANNKSVAVSATGSGEMFIRTSAAYNVHSRYTHLGENVQKAGDAVIKEIGDIKGTGGMIILDAKGNFAFPMNSGGMHRGMIDSKGVPMTAMFGDEQLRHFKAK